MVIGVYFPDGECVKAPLEQAAQLVGVSEGFLLRALDGKQRVTDAVISILPRDTAFWIPKKCRKLRGAKGCEKFGK